MIIPGREMEGADLKGHFSLVTWPPSLPSPSFPGILGEQCPLQKGEVAAWPGPPPECQWAHRGTGLSRSEPGTTPLHIQTQSAASVFAARAGRLFLLHSADALGRLGCLCAVATAGPLEGVWGPSILKVQPGRGGRRASPPASWLGGYLVSSTRLPRSSPPAACFPLRHEALFFPLLSTGPRTGPELPSHPGLAGSVGRGLSGRWA